MNSMEVIKKYLTQGLTPENIVTKMAGNNPIVQDLIKKVRNGNIKEAETFVRNVYKEKGIDIDEIYSQMTSTNNK